MTDCTNRFTPSLGDTGAPVAARPRFVRFALLATGAAAAALVGGCSNHAPRPDKMAQQARDAMGKGDAPRAVALAEQAVQGDGRNASLRLLLGNAYLRSGRFESARMAYSDAIDLGDDSSRAALGLVLADLALGRNGSALDTLNTYGDVLPVADLGLALTMAGQNQRGITVLSNAIRQGQNIPKVRQNLAYAYALSGMWNEARIMVGQDLPADQVDARLQAWAAMARPEESRRRVASLIGSPLVGDSGQPEALALAHFPGPQSAQAQATQAPAPQVTPAAPAPVQAAATELPPVQAQTESGALARIDLPASRPAAALPVSVPAPVPVAYRAIHTPAPVRASATVAPIRPSPIRPSPIRPSLIRAVALATPVHGLGTHLVQLGAFNSEESANRAWHHFVARNPRLAGHPDLITKVNVHGRDFWRVQAAGFAGQASASSVCGALRAHGGACLVMAVNAAAHVNGVQSAAAHPVVKSVIKPQPSPIRPAAAHTLPTRPGKTNPARR